MMKAVTPFLLTILVFSGGIVTAQSSDISRATLHYELSGTAAQNSAGISGLYSAQEASSTTDLKSGLLQSLLDRMGRKEQKVVKQLLDVGVKTNLINLEKIEKKLGQINLPAIIGLYNDLKAMKLSGLDIKKLENIQRTLSDIDAAIKKADLKAPEFGKLNFFAGLTRDRLADMAGTAEEKSALRAAAISNYSDTVKSLANDKTAASQEKVADAAERLATLENPFGDILPVGSAKSNVKAVITSDYGVRVHPVKKTRRFHTGVDLAGWKCSGWQVKAIGPGRVVKSGWESGYGYSVVVSHEIEGRQLFTRYAHLMKKSRIGTGELVKTGDQIGLCNNSGISTGAHLHFEVREGSASGITHDPKEFLPDTEKL